MAVGQLGVRPDDFYNMSLREFYSALFAKFPPEDRESTFESPENFFDEEDLEILNRMVEQ